MTPNEQKAQALFEKWKYTQDWFYKEPIHILDQNDAVSFAAFCLDQREKELAEDQVNELIEIGNRHIYFGLEDEAKMHSKGVLEIIKRYEEMKTLTKLL